MNDKTKDKLLSIKGQMEMVEHIDWTLETLEYNIPEEKFKEIKETIDIVKAKHLENAEYELKQIGGIK